MKQLVDYFEDYLVVPKMADKTVLRKKVAQCKTIINGAWKTLIR